MADGEETLLTAFQIEIAQLFFSLPASDGFLLAGGGALLAQGLTRRPTIDLDFFTRPGGGTIQQARDEFIAAVTRRGWGVDQEQDEASFCRLAVHGDGDLVIDLALDSVPWRPPADSVVGPTFALDELAGRKVIALFDRAAARDFVDVFALSQRFSKATMLDCARQIDAGFDVRVFIEMIDTLRRYPDSRLALGDVDVAALRAFFRGWRAELAEEGSGQALGGD